MAKRPKEADVIVPRDGTLCILRMKEYWPSVRGEIKFVPEGIDVCGLTLQSCKKPRRADCPLLKHPVVVAMEAK